MRTKRSAATHRTGLDPVAAQRRGTVGPDITVTHRRALQQNRAQYCTIDNVRKRPVCDYDSP
jgi:hypothetical protein